MPEWFGQTYTPAQNNVIVISIVMIVLIGVIVLLYISDIYRLCPGWGAIRRFDADGTEDMRIRQVIIHEHARKLQDHRLITEHDKSYGSLGRPTWGVCQSPNQSRVPILHPELGHVTLHEGFAETQKMREHCEWWAKDEIYFMAQKGVAPPTTVL
uniref:Uncharacterized protein n=1 Tax=Strombidinopsis acuminata TaxID=141414 RepID=A0A7S3X9Y0_9SPIT|mmetsp:Transcript_45509/g.117684  ORF Transcript_45509/g.117684 Transcript_45509/m.117684 type:complete len:155 (-) Transcript_45509:103-567(-)